MKKVIVNSKVVTQDGIVEHLNVHLFEGKISSFDDTISPDESVIDAQGLYLAPGFIDLHCHGALGCDFMDGKKENVEKACNYHLSHGTTSIYPTTCTESIEKTHAALQALALAKPKNHLQGVHVESFFFSPVQSGAQDMSTLKDIEESVYMPFLNAYCPLIKRWSYAPELKNAEQFENALKEKHVLLSNGHTNAEYHDVLRAHQNGCHLITHLYSCTSTIVRKMGFRHLGVVESALLLDDMYVELITDGCHIPTELLKLVYKVKGADRICLVTDANGATGTTNTHATISGNPCIIEDGVAKLPDRSAFAGSIATTDRLVREALKADIPLHQAIKMVTQTPATVMGLCHKGKIAENHHADLVLFDQNIHIQKVFVMGEEITSFD